MSRQGAPVLSTHKIPFRSYRWSCLGRPRVVFAFGSNGSIRSHCSFVRSPRFPMPTSLITIFCFAYSPWILNCNGGVYWWDQYSKLPPYRHRSILDTSHYMDYTCRLFTTFHWLANQDVSWRLLRGETITNRGKSRVKKKSSEDCPASSCHPIHFNAIFCKDTDNVFLCLWCMPIFRYTNQGIRGMEIH